MMCHRIKAMQAVQKGIIRTEVKLAMLKAELIDARKNANDQMKRSFPIDSFVYFEHASANKAIAKAKVIGYGTATHGIKVSRRLLVTGISCTSYFLDVNRVKKVKVYSAGNVQKESSHNEEIPSQEE